VFVPPDDSPVEPSAIALSVDGESCFVWTRDAPDPDHLERVRSIIGGRIDLVALQIAVPSHEPLATALDDAVAAVHALDAPVVMPHGGPPCFLDPELAHLNDELAHGGLPTATRLAQHLRTRLPERHVTTLLPGDRLFPRDGVVVEDPTWATFPEFGMADYLRNYAHRRALELSYLHTRFLPPDHSLAPGFAAHVHHRAERLVGPADEVRFEVTGRGGGVWDVVVDDQRVHVVGDRGRPVPATRVRVDSRWLAAVVDGRASWRQLLRSFRCDVTGIGTRTGAGAGVEVPVLDRLARADDRVLHR
jgi:UDP-MurNAc hydroxylase